MLIELRLLLDSELLDNVRLDTEELLLCDVVDSELNELVSLDTLELLDELDELDDVENDELLCELLLLSLIVTVFELLELLVLTVLLDDDSELVLWLDGDDELLELDDVLFVWLLDDELLDVDSELLDELLDEDDKLELDESELETEEDSLTSSTVNSVIVPLGKFATPTSWECVVNRSTDGAPS